MHGQKNIKLQLRSSCEF